MGSETMLTLKVVMLACCSWLKNCAGGLILRNSGELDKSLLLMGSNLKFSIKLNIHKPLRRVSRSHLLYNSMSAACKLTNPQF